MTTEVFNSMVFMAPFLTFIEGKLCHIVHNSHLEGHIDVLAAHPRPHRCPHLSLNMTARAEGPLLHFHGPGGPGPYSRVKGRTILTRMTKEEVVEFQNIQPR